MLTKNHDTLTAEVKKHIAADAVVQGTYWDGQQGCFIGCLAHSADAIKLQEKFGLPLPLVKVCEGIFELMNSADAKAFFSAIPDAVGYDGKDLSRVVWRFLGSELRALPKVTDDIQAVIDPVVAGMDRLSAGEEWGVDAARAARAAHAAYEAARAAYAAARAACAAARAAARAAADAASDAASDAAAYEAARAAYAAARAARAAAYAAADAARAASDPAAYPAARAAADAAARAAADAASDPAAYPAAYEAAYEAVIKRQRDTILRLMAEAK